MERKNNDELEEILADYARLKEKELMEENTEKGMYLTN